LLGYAEFEQGSKFLPRFIGFSLDSVWFYWVLLTSFFLGLPGFQGVLLVNTDFYCFFFKIGFCSFLMGCTGYY